MQVTNVRGHRIRWRVLMGQGAFVGSVSSLFMLVVATLLYPLLDSATDGWTFLKVVSTAVLGQDAADPLTGFAAVPVLAGLVVHLAIGAIAGLTYACLVGMFDLEGWTPVALFGLLYGAMLFVWSTVAIGAGLGGTAIEGLPPVVMLWGNISFGLCAGVLLATWADQADIDQVQSERVPPFEGDLDR